jgi:hypothetical protein
LTCAKASRWTQPVSNPTRIRAGPRAGVTGGVEAVNDRRLIDGASLTSARIRPGSRFRSPLRSTSGLIHR